LLSLFNLLVAGLGRLILGLLVVKGI